MRLFIAIPLPEDVKQRLEELQQPVEGIRWQQSRQYHLTLRFVGEVDNDVAQTIQNRLKAVGVAPFSFDLNGPGYFPEHKYPRVLWIGVEEVPALMKLQSEIEQVCQDAGLKSETRDFKPHITLGKVKGASKRDVMSFINQHKQFRMTNIPISEFILYSSRLHSSGAIHKPLERYSLA